ncbi:ABC transporter permease [Marinoscillum sp.]|uniref:ABC transporter permease n=1 Tax=Marinoscillum sp. TaxID=2024838 RepID=UPI003BA93E61
MAINHPPKLANRVLKGFCKPQYLEDIQGDLEEEFYDRLDDAPKASHKLWYWWQILKLFRTGIIRRFRPIDSTQKEINMFKNYFKIGLRNLWRYKLGTFINVLGLSTGIAAFVLIALFIKDELKYDTHHEKADQIYRLTIKNLNSDGLLSRHWAFASAGHAERLKADYSEVKKAVRFMPWAFPDVVVEGKKFPSEQVVFTDPDVFDIFTFPFIQGDPGTAFSTDQSLVISESAAIKLFGNDWGQSDIIGRRVSIERDGMKAPFTVSGVMKDMPEHQHFHFEYLAPIRFIEQVFGESAMNNVTGNYNWLTYLLLQEGTDPESIESRKDEFFDKYVGKTSGGADAKDFYDFELQPLQSIHLESHLEGEIETNGSIDQVYIFGIVGILLLVVACINYMNLATSHFSRRMKEVGVRKVLGAMKSTLVKQFLTEAFLVNLIALPFAILFTELALPYLNDFMEKSIELNLLSELDIVGSLVILLVLVAIFSGSYPSIFLSRIELTRALKGEAAINSNKWNFRNWLVTFQYAVTIALIFSLTVIEGQLHFIQNTDPGYKKDQIVNVSLTRNINRLDALKNEMLNHPNIEKLTFASRIPTGRLADSWGAGFNYGDSTTTLNFRLPFIWVDEDFLETFEIDLIAGSNFTSDQDMLEDSVGYYLINETGARALGFNDPQEIIGKKLSYGAYNDQTLKAGRILGVTRDFHFESLHSTLTPMLMLKGDRMRVMSLQIRSEEVSETLAFMEETWNTFDPENPIDYEFLDDRFMDQYQAEMRLSTMIKVFTGIAILIGCLGLIGMVGFIIETKSKEIGIRKVLGASALNIATTIGNRFVLLIGIASIIAIPIAFYLISGWLDEFVYRTSISVLMVIIPTVLVLLITVASVGFQTIKASLVNPAEILKDE